MSAFLITAFLCSAIVLGMSSDQSIMKLGDKRDDLVHVGGMMIKEGKMMDFMSSLFVVRCSLWALVASSPKQQHGEART
jgi:hypothetical protein